MKKIILLFIICIVNITSTFAESSISLSIDKSNFELLENVKINIVVETDNQDNIEILDIEGLYPLTEVSTSLSNRIQIIHGKTLSQQLLSLHYKTNIEGEFIIGPVNAKVGDENISSESVKIYVGKENFNKDSNISGEENNTTEVDRKTEDINITIETEEKIIKEKIKEEKNTEEDTIDSSSDMKDIHDVKNLAITIDKFKYNLVIKLLLLVLGLYILYLIINKILLFNNIRKKNIVEEQVRGEYMKQEKNNIYKEILTLSENMENIGKDDFYADLNYLFRRYFVYLGVNNAYKMTLQELQKMQIETKIFEIFSKSYMYEFSPEEDSISKRKQIVMNFMIYLKK